MVKCSIGVKKSPAIDGNSMKVSIRDFVMDNNLYGAYYLRNPKYKEAIDNIRKKNRIADKDLINIRALIIHSGEHKIEQKLVGVELDECYFIGCTLSNNEIVAHFKTVNLKTHGFFSFLVIYAFLVTEIYGRVGTITLDVEEVYGSDSFESFTTQIMQFSRDVEKTDVLKVHPHLQQALKDIDKEVMEKKSRIQMKRDEKPDEVS